MPFPPHLYFSLVPLPPFPPYTHPSALGGGWRGRPSSRTKGWTELPRAQGCWDTVLGSCQRASSISSSLPPRHSRRSRRRPPSRQVTMPSTAFPSPVIPRGVFFSPSCRLCMHRHKTHQLSNTQHSHSRAHLCPESWYVKDFILFFFNCSMVEAALEGFFEKPNRTPPTPPP